MQNNLLNNQKKSEFNKKRNSNYRQHSLQPKNIDINRLLNRVKLNEKNKNKENLILFGLSVLTLSILTTLLTIWIFNYLYDNSFKSFPNAFSNLSLKFSFIIFFQSFFGPRLKKGIFLSFFSV